MDYVIGAIAVWLWLAACTWLGIAGAERRTAWCDALEALRVTGFAVAVVGGSIAAVMLTMVPAVRTLFGG